MNNLIPSQNPFDVENILKTGGITTTPFNKIEKPLKARCFNTPLGNLIAISDEDKLYFLDFLDAPTLMNTLKKFLAKEKAGLTITLTDPIRSIQSELLMYFKGTLKHFTTPVYFSGSPFQTAAWKELTRIPYGHVRSYAYQAHALGNAKAHRAVARANGANLIVIAVPCHRVIYAGGGLGGYRSGKSRKQWLIEHEKNYV